MSESVVPGDDRFFPRCGPFTIADLASCAGVEPTQHDAERRFYRVAPLQVAGPDEVSFLDNPKYLVALDATKAGAVIVQPDLLDRVPQATIGLATRQPYLAWAKIAALFHPLPPLQAGVHPSAVIDPSARIDPSSEIGPFVVIGPRAEIGARCRVGAGAVIGQGVVIGTDGRIGAHCSVSHALIGDRVTLFAGARIGQDGFGFATTMTATGPAHISVPQLGRVVIAHDVEIGANSCVDRGSAQDTVIGAGTRIDNLVQIGHNVRIGRACVLVAQVGVAGSSELEDFVVLAGQVGVAGHVKIGRAARVGGQAGVMSNLDGGAEYVGSPAMPAKAFFRQQVALKRLAGQGKTVQAAPKAALDGETGRN